MSTEISDDLTSTVDPRIAYRVGRVAFFLAAVVVALGSLNHVLYIVAPHRRGGVLIEIITSPAWNWFVVGPVTFGGFFAAFLLLGRWREPSWFNRSILFMLIQTYLIVYWYMDNREVFGQAPLVPRRRFDMSGQLTMRTLGFVSMMTLGSMAYDVLARYGRSESEGLQRATRAACGVGLSLLVILALRLYDRFQPWPPRFHRITDLETFQIFMGAMLARPIAGAFVCILCARACVVCSRELDRVQKAMIEDDPFRSRSERA